MVSVSVPSVQSSLERLIFHQDALPHGKSSFVRFKYLFSSDSELVSPPSLQRRSSALEQEKNKSSVREKEEDYS